LLIFLEVTIDNVGDVFFQVFCLLQHILLDLLSLNSVEAYTE